MKACQTDIVFSYPWGNMRDYYLWLHENTGFRSEIYKPSLFPFNVLNLHLLDKERIKDGIRFHLDRHLGKLRRKHEPSAFRKTLRSAAYTLKYSLLFLNAYRFLKRYTPKILCVWNGLQLREKAVIDAAERLGITVVYFENGFLPNTTLADTQGVNVESSLPRNAQFYRDYLETIGGEQALKALDSKLDVRAPHQSKSASSHSETLIDGKYFFIPFQVDVDSQVLYNSKRIKSMYALYEEIEVIALRHPDWQFVMKEHPSCVRSYSELHQRQPNIHFTSANTEELIRNSEAIITLNSSVGLEALLQFKKVCVLGEAVYEIDGICKKANSTEELESLLQAALDDSWQPDQTLINTFLNYMKNAFLVAGAWRKADEIHLKSFETYIQHLIEAQIKD